MSEKTIRQQIIAILREDDQGIRDLSQLLGRREKEIIDHLPHIKRSIKTQEGKFITTPASCMHCGYEFIKRNRLSSPGKCPFCKSSHIQDPLFRIK
jgi:predicted Zn-ribbon and HTH transcriptional regulator